MKNGHKVSHHPWTPDIHNNGQSTTKSCGEKKSAASGEQSFLTFEGIVRHFLFKPSGGDRVATMIGGSFLSVLSRGFFNVAVNTPLSMVVCDDGAGGSRKRRRDLLGGSRTPTLISPTNFNEFSCGDVRDPDDSSEANDRPRKRFRGQSKIINLTPALSIVEPPKKPKNKQTGDLLNKLPEDVVAHCLSFLGSSKDRFALQTTCKLFKDISNSDAMLANVDVGGDLETGKGGIIQEHSSPATAGSSLAPFARAGNLQALYMYVISTVNLYWVTTKSRFLMSQIIFVLANKLFDIGCHGPYFSPVYITALSTSFSCGSTVYS